MLPLPDMDAKLYYAVKCALGRLPATTYDLKKVKVLDQFFGSVDPYYENIASSIAPGDFSAIGLMENLHTLKFSHSFDKKTLQINDFSFLTRCKKLKRLDMGGTNFTDCSLLLELPALTFVCLPEKEHLTHLEALSALPDKTKVVILPYSETVSASAPATASASGAAPAGTSASDIEPPARYIPEGSEKIKAIINELKTRTAADCYELVIQPEKQPNLFDSKFGGLPYWDLSKPYPAGENGKKLALLAQINFEQFPAKSPLPQRGMLQFFAAQDDYFGADWEHLDRQSGFRVIYHESIDRSLTVQQVQALNIPTQAGQEYWPVYREVSVKMQKAVSYMGPEDTRFDDVFRQAVKAVTGEDIGEIYPDQYLSEEDNDYLWEHLSASGHRLLGYPYFTQADPRPEGSSFDTLLLQIDSDSSDETDYIMWGDCGVGNFFINLEDLKKLDFSKVLYTWDCC